MTYAVQLVQICKLLAAFFAALCYLADILPRVLLFLDGTFFQLMHVDAALVHLAPTSELFFGHCTDYMSAPFVKNYLLRLASLHLSHWLRDYYLVLRGAYVAVCGTLGLILPTLVRFLFLL